MTLATRVEVSSHGKTVLSRFVEEGTLDSDVFRLLIRGLAQCPVPCACVDVEKRLYLSAIEKSEASEVKKVFQDALACLEKSGTMSSGSVDSVLLAPKEGANNTEATPPPPPVTAKTTQSGLSALAALKAHMSRKTRAVDVSSGPSAEGSLQPSLHPSPRCGPQFPPPTLDEVIAAAAEQPCTKKIRTEAKELVRPSEDLYSDLHVMPVRRSSW